LLSFYDKVDFSATILARLMIMGQMINLKVYISVRHVSPCLDLIFMVEWTC